MKVYMLHITCSAKHRTYIDYKTKKFAEKNLNKLQDKSDWYATHIEIIEQKDFEKRCVLLKGGYK